MADLSGVAYCGLYCRLCANLARIPQQASALRETLRREGWEYFGPSCLPGFEQFWAALERLSRPGETCRGGCGDPGCPIRTCARERGIQLCPACPEYPCQHIEELARRYPSLIFDGRRQQQIGLEKWIQEQEQRRAAGFCYADIRCARE